MGWRNLSDTCEAILRRSSSGFPIVPHGYKTTCTACGARVVAVPENHGASRLHDVLPVDSLGRCPSCALDDVQVTTDGV